jgi:cell division protein FtsB
MYLIVILLVLTAAFVLGVFHAAGVSARFKQLEADFAALKAKVAKL